MLRIFTKYTSVGVVNTLIHWMVFAICLRFLHANQTVSNFADFFIAVSFSFFANARFTFKAEKTIIRYMLYAGFMGALSMSIGWVADKSDLPPVITLITFSVISLVCGFIYSKLIVYRDVK